MLLYELPTPCVLIERRRLVANIDAMQRRATANDVNLRPHIKTHRSSDVARRQLDAGAKGITVAKTSEAEVFVSAGFDDVRIAYPVIGADKWERILSMQSAAHLSFCIDTPVAARAASDFFEARGAAVDVLLEVDTGHHRSGVDPAAASAVETAQLIEALPGIQLVGILTHAGHAYHGPQEGETRHEALRRISDTERDTMLHFASELRQADISAVAHRDFTISIGSTPTMSAFENTELDGFRISEIRPGNYVFHDMTQVSLGSARLQDCALTILATVVSRRRLSSGGERLFLDAGSKMLTSDTGALTDGYGQILFNASTMTPLPHARLSTLSEEHGWVDVPGGATLEIGDRVRVVPNHACVVANMVDNVHLVDGETFIADLPVSARGHSQ